MCLMLYDVVLVCYDHGWRWCASSCGGGCKWLVWHLGSYICRWRCYVGVCAPVFLHHATDTVPRRYVISRSIEMPTVQPQSASNGCWFQWNDSALLTQLRTRPHRPLMALWCSTTENKTEQGPRGSTITCVVIHDNVYPLWSSSV